jgi:dipeptidyl aminopeptidase/acylaminoacyl peptidase
VSWSRDETRLATANDDGTATVWQAAGGRELLTLKEHTGIVSSVSWSPDGRRLATAGEDGTAKVWDGETGRELLTLEGHTSGVSTVSWSPDGLRLATASYDGTVRVRDAARGHKLLKLEGHTSGVWCVAWTLDGRRLATASGDGTARVWDGETGRYVFTLKGHTSPVSSVSWSPNATRLATGCRDTTAKVWDGETGREVLTLEGHTGGVSSVSWSPDGRRLATAGEDGTAKVWDGETGRELLSLEGHTGGVSSVSWSPDGRRLATASHDGTVKVFDAASAGSVQAWARQESALQDLLVRDLFRGPNAQGHIRSWLVLLPMPMAPGETGEHALSRQQIPGQLHLRPRSGERSMVDGRELAWMEYRSPEAVVNFNAVLGQVAERSVAYAICYLESEEDRDGLWLQAGADNQSEVYLNGRLIYQCRLNHRPLWSLDTVGPVALKQGVNALLFKVVNDAGAWEGCVRLVDAAGLPAHGIRVRLTP